MNGTRPTYNGKTRPENVIAGLIRDLLNDKDTFQRRRWRTLLRHDVKGGGFSYLYELRN